MVGWWLLACDGVGTPERLLAADPERSGAPGSDGPEGVAKVRLRVAARVTDTVPVTIVYPADAALGPSLAGVGAVVLVHGGRVAPERYEWLAVHLASRGYAVTMPEAALDLAIFEPGNGEVALDALRSVSEADGVLAGLVAADGPAVVTGHSLGGVVSARQWVRDDTVDGLMLLASYAAGANPVGDAVGRPVLALGGTEDGLLPPDRMADEVARFAGPVWFGLVDGLNHFGWTDDPTAQELDGDGVAGRPVPEMRTDAERAIDLYVDAVFGDGDLSVLDGDLPGIVWR